MRLRNFILPIFLILLSCQETKFKNPHVAIQTKLGNIEIELYADKAPKSVNAFLSYVDSGYYKTSTFYRVLNQDNQPSDAYKAALIQGGVWRTNHKLSETVPRIPHETTKETGILHTNGTLSLARLEPGTASTEFFICLGDQPGFNYGGENNPDKQGYAAFGKVVKGMDIVRLIYNRPEDDQDFDPPIVIFDIVRL